MATSVTCKNCGTEDLSWRKSAKGNWYLCEPQTISTNTHGQFITIPSAHHCVEVAIVEPMSPERIAFEVEHLQALKNQFPNSWTSSDEYKLLNLLSQVAK